MLGMDMVLESMGVDPKKLQENVNTAVEHVKLISQRLTTIEQALGVVLTNSVATSATTLRIEDAIHKLATNSPDNSVGFSAEAQQQFPDAAETMQRQIEGVTSDGRKEAGTSEETSAGTSEETSR